jgi:hypothetical protein
VLTPCGHRSDKNRIYVAKKLKQNLKHCKQLRKLYLQTEKGKKKCSTQLTHTPLILWLWPDGAAESHRAFTPVVEIK